MLTSDENIKILSDFGLTANQAKVYVTIVHLGIASVGQISKISGVRREDVYRAMPKLEKLGLIERVLGTPTKIRAIPVDDALDILIKHEKDRASQKVSELATKKEEFLKNFKRNSVLLEEKSDSQFSLISEREAILSKASALVRSAKKEIDAISSRQKTSEFIFAFADLLKKAIKRGVKIRIITEMPEEEDHVPRIIDEQLSPGESLKLKYAEKLPTHCLMVDGKEMLVTTSTDARLAERPSLWTNSVSLIEPLQREFEDVWHTSVNRSSVKAENETEKVMRFIKQLKPSDHVIFVYETPEAKFNVLFNYLKYGLDNGEAALYVCSEATPGQIKNAMKNFGIDVGEREKTGALKILPYSDFYIIDGKFSITNTLDLWSKFYKEALRKGFKGLRVTGETACFFKYNMVKELVEYEKALHRTLEIPMIAICSYRVDRLNKVEDPINLYSELARAHGTVLFTGMDQSLGRMELRKG
jgi:sugar-specific transcriptional regulator TrmB